MTTKCFIEADELEKFLLVPVDKPIRFCSAGTGEQKVDSPASRPVAKPLQRESAGSRRLLRNRRSRK